MDWRNRWQGGTAVCLASGPSLTPEDAARAIAWRDAGPNRVAICTNTTFRIVPTADALFGFDLKWWTMYIDEVRRDFKGERISRTQMPESLGVKRVSHINPFGNSGAAAISVAILTGCERVILLGYDAMHGPNGEAHHHGDHPKGLGNAFSLPKWPKHFENVAAHATGAGVTVINCSRRTALTCFPRAGLAETLQGFVVPEGAHDLLRMQRTHYGPDLAGQYEAELQRTMDSMASVLPAAPARIADVGCGMAGIDVLLSRHYRHAPELWLIDRDGVGEGRKIGYGGADFAPYHSFDLAEELLTRNDVPREKLRRVDLGREAFPSVRFDLVVSLLSWGFHFPVSAYKPDFGLLVIDVRKGTDGEATLKRWGRCEVIHEGIKYRRIACSR